ncbi:hypothetical protein SAMN04489810_3525 [Microbacterium pygmaeum]|uniref:Uncharacterized protein n=1 Tax=Microbacterium pygmaeum TaxID=370764 RepID=A0A1G8E455_9MICO|nr:hypothetical protein SAMN04489810_0012 [Microbacterium pygmaeum]SDH64635.1 hypothetical protein SAMN04489810_3525 [Microbacterium pygmaeum]
MPGDADGVRLGALLSEDEVRLGAPLSEDGVRLGAPRSEDEVRLGAPLSEDGMRLVRFEMRAGGGFGAPQHGAVSSSAPRNEGGAGNEE